MPLDKDILKKKISIFADQLHSLFEGFPNGINDNAEKWADAIDTYAKVVVPSSLSSAVAKESFIKIMKQLSPPFEEDPNPLPFTLYYKSPERRMNVFNSYLRDIVKYKSNPSLDKTQVFTILSNIREEYNKQRPIYAFSKDDIFYNQRRFNEIYATDITQGTIIPLQRDGVTSASPNPFYQNIPTELGTGKIIALQKDGIIGDDTIRYFPFIDSNIYTLENNRDFIIKYRTLKFITQPKLTGEVDVSIPNIINSTFIQRLGLTLISAFDSKKKYIDTGLMKDYTKIVLDKSQSDLDGGTFATPQPMSYFKQEFERRHSLYDNFWLKNNITTIAGLIALLQTKKFTYKAKPKNEKDGIATLENAITAYALSLSIGMNPTFTGSPSVVPINLSPVATQGLAGASNADCIATMVDLIDAYFKGGTATNNSSGVTTTWN